MQRTINLDGYYVEGADHQLVSQSSGCAMTIGEAYATLGLDASSTTPDEGRSRFHVLIRLNHPDGKPSHEQARANETTRIIVEASTLLRMQGFPRIVIRNRTPDGSGDHYERQAAAEPGSAEPLAWVDAVWRECVRGHLIYGLSSAFGVRFALGAWMSGWEIMRGDRTKSND